MDLLRVSAISKKIGNRLAVKNTSFSQRKFQKLGIAGETGSGKSTLLKIVGGLEQADSGEVYFEDVRVKGPEEKLLPGHPSIAYLSQHFELRNNYWVHEVLSYANKLTREEAEHLYQVCQIDHLLERRTNQLSGGEKQRIALARLLTTSPKLLLLDEPFSNLDVLHKNTLKEVIEDISDKLEITCIMISHEPIDLLSWADEILVMKDGDFVQKGSPAEIYKQPKNEYVAGLFGSYSILNTCHLPNVFISGVNEKIVIRPESFKLVENEKTGMAGVVEKTRFYGSFFEIDVALPAVTITVKTLQSEVSTGQTVFVTVDEKDIWRL